MRIEASIRYKMDDIQREEEKKLADIKKQIKN
jgi:hypothetical protein